MSKLFDNLPHELRSNSGIYMILNLINGNCYIGSSIKFKSRFNKHINELVKNRHHSKHLQYAYNLYGKNNFEFKILQYANENLETLEQEWIDWLKPDYNTALVAGSPLGIKRSEETKDKMREAAKLRLPPNEETRAKMSASAKIKIFTAEHRLKMSKSQSGRKHTEETKIKQSLAAKGKPKSAEHKIKNGLAKRDPNKWPHKKGNRCTCRECLDKRNVIQRLKYAEMKAQA